MWSVQTNRKATDLAGNARSWSTWINGVYWPPVLLTTPTFAEVLDINDEIHHYVLDYDIKHGYGGPTKATIEESWSVTPPTLDSPVSLLPRAIRYQGIMVNFTIEPTLHTRFTITENTGTSHPKYAFQVRTRIWQPTTYTDWPASYLYRDTCKPGKGGFIRTKVTVFKPVDV